MSPEKYVKQVTHKVVCSKSKKRDIEKQLLAEITERMQAGEGVDCILSSMGSADEIAEGFNESISEAEKKACKRQKLYKILIVVVLIIVIAGIFIRWSMPKTNDVKDSQIFNQTEVEQKLMEVIDLLDKDDYDTLQEMSIDQLKPVLTKTTMDSAKEDLSTDWGERTALGSIYSQEVTQKGRHYVICQVNASYKNVSVTYTITFDEHMKLAGLYLK